MPTADRLRWQAAMVQIKKEIARPNLIDGFQDIAHPAVGSLVGAGLALGDCSFEKEFSAVRGSHEEIGRPTVR